VETESEFEVPTWNQIYAMLLSQAEKIRQSSFKLDVIAGITRGGLAPARILADLLEITDVITVGVEFYVSVAETRGEPVLTQRVSADVKDQKALLVDDVADTGKSLRLAREHLRQQGATEIRIATLYSKPLSVIKPNYYEKETCRWVVFPWDVKETIRKIVEKHSDKHATKTEIAKLVEAGLPKQLVEKFMKEVREAEKC
jgi:hypoxanthine phosphoribosyltransferase